MHATPLIVTLVQLKPSALGKELQSSMADSDLQTGSSVVIVQTHMTSSVEAEWSTVLRQSDAEVLMLAHDLGPDG